jgi:galactonate dehydratase
MKVTKIETFISDVYRTNWVFIKVHTDSGLYGVGEATLEYQELTVEAAVLELNRYMVGKDPHNIEAFFHDTLRNAYWRGGPVLMSAIAGVEMALWDIKGKDLGVPVYQLLGGKVRDKVPCYANGWFAPAKTPEEFAAKAKETVKKGYKGLKWDPFGAAYLTVTKAELSHAVECIGAVKDAVGNEIEILIEGHGRFNLPTAIKIAHAIEELDVLWFEEPLPPENLEGLAQLKKRTKIPIAAGERLYGRMEYRPFFNLECADFAQPDVSHSGGIMETRKIAAMAECHHIPVCPHNPQGPIANAATLQIAACTPNFYLLETMSTDIPYRRELTTERIVFEQGFMKIGNAPGLGIDILTENCKKYPYQPHDLRHYTGKLTEIRPANAEDYFQ